VEQLLERIQSVGRRLVAASPRELTIGNVIRRILGLIRDEAEEDRNEETGNATPADSPDQPPAVASPMTIDSAVAKVIRPAFPTAQSTLTRTQSMFNILADPDSVPPGWMNSTPLASSGASTPLGHSFSTNTSALRSEVLDGIEEIMDEIKQVDDQLCSYSDIIIHPGDYILVYKPSRTVQRFLTRSKRKFTLFVVTDPTAQSGPDPYASLRKSLAANGSILISIHNAGLMAYMTKVNKVILSARAITGTAGVTADAGAASVARAARSQGRTVIVLGGVYKLSPDSQVTQSIATEWGNPSAYVDFSDGQLVGKTTVKNAVSEFIPAADINVYITNLGAHSREHLHTVINDHYKEADVALDLYAKIRK
jgi:translation initiation factor eIF-2B subunit beta